MGSSIILDSQLLSLFVSMLSVCQLDLLTFPVVYGYAPIQPNYLGIYTPRDHVDRDSPKNPPIHNPDKQSRGRLSHLERLCLARPLHHTEMAILAEDRSLTDPRSRKARFTVWREGQGDKEDGW